MKNTIQSILKSVFDYLVSWGKSINAYRTLNKRNYY